MAPRKLEISGLSKWFGDLEAVRNIDVAVERREFISVVGPSGCGKTTLLRMVAGLEAATSGTIVLDGRAVSEPGANRGFVFQNNSLLPWRTVLANALIGPEVKGAVGDAECRRILELLKLVGLEGFEIYYPRQLSGGLRQRVNLARALAIDPDVLLKDERSPRAMRRRARLCRPSCCASGRTAARPYSSSPIRSTRRCSCRIACWCWRGVRAGSRRASTSSCRGPARSTSSANLNLSLM
jgi:ABC-type transporter Mla maintaining outer membrane lipid asymmetry ATPase subunit MlaF